MARVLAHPAELLVLDEPTNHLDLGAVAWLEQRLLAFRGGLVLVTHDRHLLDRLTTRMLELDRGRAYVHEGGYGSYLEAKAEREEHAASRRIDPAQPGPAGIGLAPPGRQGPVAQAAGPDRRRRPADRGGTRPGVADDRAREAGRHPASGRQGHRVRRASASATTRARWCSRMWTWCSDRRERLGIVGANGSGKSTLRRPVGRTPPADGRAY